MKAHASIAITLILLSGCGGSNEQKTMSLTAARKGVDPRPFDRSDAPSPAPAPPPELFNLVKYDSKVGPLSAYVTPDPGDGQKHPAIVWITGGDCNSIGELWKDESRDNDQTASPYRKLGLIVMFPSLRGGNDNPGTREGFFGEVDDVIAAADYLSHLDYVDPERIYLGGHSTGGTLVMLVAETTDRFRAVFSFGPVDDVSGYPPEFRPFSTSDRNQVELRSPGYWMDSVHSPLFVFEGDDTSGGNIRSLWKMQRSTKNPKIQFFGVPGRNHFSTLAPMNEMIAVKILKDDGAKTNITFTSGELNDLP